MAAAMTEVQEFVDRVVGDFGAAFNAPLVLIGDRLGLYRAMADAGPLTPEELAERTGTEERYVREWLSAQAASGYVEYDPAGGTFRLPPEQAMALADENSPAFVPGAFQIVAAMAKDEAQITERFRTGDGFGWHEHHPDLFAGTDRKNTVSARLEIPPTATNRLVQGRRRVGGGTEKDVGAGVEDDVDAGCSGGLLEGGQAIELLIRVAQAVRGVIGVLEFDDVIANQMLGFREAAERAVKMLF